MEHRNILLKIWPAVALLYACESSAGGGPSISVDRGASSCNGSGAGGNGRVEFEFTVFNGKAFGTPEAQAAAALAASPPPGCLREFETAP